MNDRTFTALASASLQETPLASLDYEQQLFVLTPQHLLFQPNPQASVQVVALQNITRIHSDPAGTLRIETGAQTAITASLIGYDPGRVQRFFQQVRDTTARIKQTPAPPIVPLAPAASLFNKASAAPSESLASGPALGTPQPKPAQPQAAQPQAAQPQAAQPQATPTFAEPVSRTVITPVVPATVPATTPATVPAASITPLSAVPAASASAVSSVPVSAAPLPAAPLEPTLAQAALLRRARSVGRLAGVARLLALVLVAGSLGMGYVLWTRGGQAQQLTALWTVTMGLVTATALLILAEVVRFLSALGHVSAEQS